MSQDTSSAPVESTPTVSESIEQIVEEVGSPVDQPESDENQEEVEETDDDSIESEETPEGDDGEETEVTDQEATEQAIKDFKKKLKLKVDGEEIEEEIDFEDDEALTRHLQKSKAFDKKAQETAQYRKTMDTLFAALKEDPVTVFKELGMNFDELAYNHLNGLVEESKKSPEQVEREKMEKRLKELEDEKAAMVKAKEEAEIEAHKNQVAQKIESDIVSALEKHDGILSTKDPEAIGDIARALYRYRQAGQNVSVEQVLPIVEKRYLNKLRARSENWTEADFNKIFGKKKMAELRKKRVKSKKAQTQTARQMPNNGTPAPPAEEAPKKKVSYKDFFSNHKGVK